MNFRTGVVGLAILGAFWSPAGAAETLVAGKIIMVGGHLNPACRQVNFKRNDNGAVISLRMGNYTSETGIASVVLTAMTTGMTVLLDYDPAVTSGCGTEPAIIYVNAYPAGYGP